MKQLLNLFIRQKKKKKKEKEKTVEDLVKEKHRMVVTLIGAVGRRKD